MCASGFFYNGHLCRWCVHRVSHKCVSKVYDEVTEAKRINDIVLTLTNEGITLCVMFVVIS